MVDVGLGSEMADTVCKKDSAWIDVRRKRNMSVNGNRGYESIDVKENLFERQARYVRVVVAKQEGTESSSK